MSLDACLTGREGQGAGVQEPQPGQHCVVAAEVPKHGETSSFIYAFSANSVIYLACSWSVHSSEIRLKVSKVVLFTQFMEMSKMAECRSECAYLPKLI